MKKIIYALILPLVVLSGLLFTHCEIKNETAEKPSKNRLTAAEMKSERKKWEASPDGVMYKKWEASPAGQKVQASENKIKQSIRDYNNMEGIVTSLALPPGSRLGFGVMVRIDGDDYILNFGLADQKELQQLQNLKVNDKIIIKSHGLSHAPKYSYPIVSGDYVERDGQIMYKRAPRKDGC